ncbi:MAG: signal peptidase I [Thermoleophilaceae bacterium]
MVAIALVLALGIQAFLVKPFRIPSESMVPALTVGQRILADRVSFRFTDPERGDIVVFKPPAGADNATCGADHGRRQPCPRPTEDRSEMNFVKRVVALPGDRVGVRDGRAVVNGRPLDEPYVRADAECGICDLPTEITVPEDHYFMMGDNRGASEDSRVWGPVPEEWIIGQAIFTYWPPKRVGFP